VLFVVLRIGYTFAQKELKEPQPENAAPNQTKTLSVPIAQTNNAPIEAPQKLQKVAQKHISGDMSGLYAGTLLRYDFSGQNVISTTPIELHLDQNGTALSGIWKEQAGDSIAFTAAVNEKNIVFANSKIERIEHFSHNQPKQYTFKEAQLQLIEKPRRPIHCG